MNGHLNTVTAFCVGELLMVFIVRHSTGGGRNYKFVNYKQG